MKIKAVIAACCVYMFTGNVFAQVSNYTFSQSSNTYSSIAGTNLGAANWDDAVNNITIPFSFNVNGTNYTTCNVNSNGYITFGTTAPATNNYTPISSATGYNAAVSAFGRDLVNNGVRITYTTLNASPSRIFVVQWNNARRFNGTGSVPGDVLNFQIRLYETSNIVEVMYGACTATSTLVITSPQVGLRGAANTDYNNRTTATDWTATTAGGANNATCTFSNSVTPASGLTYTWTPPPPVAINTTSIHPAASNINQNSTDNAVASYQVITGGTALTPSGFSFTTAGTYIAVTDITNYKLYQNNTNTLAGAALVQTITATGNPQTINFNTGFSALAANSTTYFLIAADVPLSAVPGNNIRIASTALSNFSFTSPVTRSGDNSPALQSNVQTITGPLVTIAQAHPAAGNILQNSTNNPVASYQMTVVNGDVIPSGFTFVTAGTYANAADITNFSLYQNTTNSLTGAVLVGSVAGTTRPQTILFNSGFSNITTGSTVYFIITADVALTATNGNTINIATDNFSNFSFTTISGAGVGKAGTNPVPAGNTQTIIAPVVTVTQAHPATGNILQNTNNNILASYRMDIANGDVIPTNLTFTTAGTYIQTTDITTFRLYQNNGNNLSSSTLIGTIATSANPQTLTFNSGFNTLISGSTSYFLITADVPLSGLNGDNIYIQAANFSNFSFTGISGGTVTVAGTNPVTASNLKTIYGGTVAISTAHPAAGYITLGTINNIIAAYQIDANNAASITPTNITLTTAGTYVAGDLVNFKLYQNTGVTLTGATLVGTVAAPVSGGSISFSSGFLSIPSAGTSYLMITADVGIAFSAVPHTVWFTSNAFTNFDFTGSGGTGVQKTGTNPAALSFTQTIRDPQVAIATQHPIPGSIKTGSQNNLIASYKLTTTYGTITPASVTLTTAGTFLGINDISIFNLYQNNANSLTGATLVGTVNIMGASSANTLVFNSGLFMPVAPATSNYLLLVADVAGTATPLNTVTVTTTSITNFTFTSTGPVTITGSNPQPAPAAPGQTIVLKLDIFSSGSIPWNTTSVNWSGNTGGPYNSYVWISTGIGQLENTAGLLNVTSSAAAPISARRIISTVNNYQIDATSSTNGIIFTSPSEFDISAGTTYVGGNNNANPVIYGINGISKIGAGELQIGSSLGAGFSGDLFANTGEFTLGRKASTTAAPYTYLQNNGIQVDNAIFTIAASSGANGSLRQMSSFISSGNSTLSLYRTNSSTGVWMNVIPSTNNASAVAGTYVPLQVEGQMTINRGSSTNVRGMFGLNSFEQNMIAFGTTTLTGNTTLIGYSTGNWTTGSGDMINVNLGGYGHYVSGVTVATGIINDNGYSLTFLGGGNTNYDGAGLSLNATSSTMTGNWIIGDAAGANAGWLVTNTSTCLTRGTVTVNNYSKLCLQLTSSSNVNITYSPSVINIYGLGPSNQSTFPAALDFYNFATTAGTTTIPSDIVLNPVSGSKLASIGSQVGGTNANVTFILNGRLSGTAGLEKTGPGIIVLNAQNISGNYNTYTDSTRIKNGILTVNAGSNLGTGPLHLYELSGRNTTLNLFNTAQTVSSLSTSWSSNSGQSQVINLSGTIFTINQNVNTVFGNGTGTSTGYIAGTGSVIKSGTGTLSLAGPCTYTGYTQVKDGILQLNRSAGNTLPTSARVHIIGGKLLVSTNQQLTDLTLSSGTLELAPGIALIITGSFTMVPTSANIILGAGASIAYGTNGTLIYAGNVQQITSTKELPVANPPKNIAFNNYAPAGVQLNSNVSLTGAAIVNGWLDFNTRQIAGTGGTFTLNGLNNKTPKATTAAGSSLLTNLGFTGSLAIGMLVSGSGIPANSYITYIDPLISNSITISNSATASASNIDLDINTRGGLIINLSGGVDGHVQVTGSRVYNSGANFIFNAPNTGVQIYPAFPATGTLNYSPAYNVTIQAGIPNRVVMGNSHDLEISNDLTLTTGIFVTNNNLITWSNSGGTLTAPEPTWTVNSTNYTKSFIATSDLAGTPLNVANATTAFTGAAGFRIKNVTNTDTYFPVAASFLPPGTNFTLATPNRMMINNQSGTPQDYTVVVNHGDIGFTNGAGGSLRVNRIWYIKAGGTGTGKATMRLFFTKRDWTAWASGENEVETGFNYAQPALVQKDYTTGYGNFINLSQTADITNFSGGAFANDREIYGQYTVGTSVNLSDGIENFYRFSVVNPDAIILPVTVTGIKAYQAGDKIRIDWTALNEINTGHYEVEKSLNAVDFASIANMAARNNGNPQNNYYIIDNRPVPGNNFYRIKVYGNDGKITYTVIVVVNVNNGKTSISVMPNPVLENKMTVQLNNLAAGRYSILLYNSIGQQVYYRTFDHTGGSGSQAITLPSTTSAGTYVVRVFNNTANYSTKVIIQ